MTQRERLDLLMEYPKVARWRWPKYLVKGDRPQLFASIKGIEDRIDGLGDARLSDVLSLMRDWRDLILQAESERQG